MGLEAVGEEGELSIEESFVFFFLKMPREGITQD